MPPRGFYAASTEHSGRRQDALQGLEFTVEGDTTDVIDAGDASAPDKAEHEFRVADDGEDLPDAVDEGIARRTGQIDTQRKSALGESALERRTSA